MAHCPVTQAITSLFNSSARSRLVWAVGNYYRAKQEARLNESQRWKKQPLEQKPCPGSQVVCKCLLALFLPVGI